MQLSRVKCPRSRAQHTASGNRRGIRFDDTRFDRAGEHCSNHARQLRADTDAVGIRITGPGRICQRPCRLEERGGRQRRHHGHVPSAGG